MERTQQVTEEEEEHEPSIGRRSGSVVVENLLVRNAKSRINETLKDVKVVDLGRALKEGRTSFSARYRRQIEHRNGVRISPEDLGVIRCFDGVTTLRIGGRLLLLLLLLARVLMSLLMTRSSPSLLLLLWLLLVDVGRTLHRRRKMCGQISVAAVYLARLGFRPTLFCFLFLNSLSLSVPLSHTQTRTHLRRLKCILKWNLNLLIFWILNK